MPHKPDRQYSRITGVALNAVLRVSIVTFLVDALRHPRDPRYAGKAIPVRNLLVVGTLMHLVPVLWMIRRGLSGRRAYRFWADDLYLSIFWLDMAGNYFDLYDRYFNFDLIPHGHGTGALALVLLGLFDWSPLQALAVANAIHVLLEAQEYATDVFAGTHNVRGVWDSVGDLSAGFLGTLMYVQLATLGRARQRRQVRNRSRRTCPIALLP